MMRSSKYSLFAGGLLVLLLAGCGGGESSADSTATGGQPGSATASLPASVPASPPAPVVLRVESRVQPAEAARQDVSQVKTLASRVVPPAARVTLEPLSSEKSAAEPPLSGARQVGAARAVDATATASVMQGRLAWQATAAGGQVAAISFAVPDAKGVRLGVLVGQLPGSSMLRIYSQAAPDQLFEISGHELLQSIDRNLAAGDTGHAAHTWWSPEFGSPEVTLEIELPPGTPADAVQISVPTLSQMFVDLELPTGSADSVAKDIGDAGSCERDATCDPQVAGTANAVARMLFTKDNGTSYLCTGTLLNDAAGDGAPYFISAKHCVATQSVASTLQTDWFFHSPACNVRALSSDHVRRLRGARLLYAAGTTDTSFMLLNDAPPANAVFSGWDATTQSAGLAVTGLHHAGGDLLKISYGNVSGFAACSPVSSDGSYTCSNGDSANGTDLRVTWSSGSTEGGSSGSGLFSRAGSGNYLIGTLRGGNTSCSNRNGADEYGRFDLAFQTALQQWLSAPSSGPGPAGRTAVYRFYNAGTGAHFYTTSVAERDYVIASLNVFRYEGPVFYAYPANVAGQSPVYRFYNPSTRAHFYTISGSERDTVLNNPAYWYEGIAWSAQVAPGNGSVPVYRFYNPSRGTHFYTVSAAERNYVADALGAFTFEGIGYYAWDAP